MTSLLHLSSVIAYVKSVSTVIRVSIHWERWCPRDACVIASVETPFHGVPAPVFPDTYTFLGGHRASNPPLACNLFLSAGVLVDLTLSGIPRSGTFRPRRWST